MNVTGRAPVEQVAYSTLHWERGLLLQLTLAIYLCYFNHQSGISHANVGHVMLLQMRDVLLSVNNKRKLFDTR